MALSRKQTSRGKGKAKGSSRARGAAAPIVRDSAKNDIYGVIAVVLAIALALTLLVSTDAIVSSAVRDALQLCFGAGAMLVPVALLVFAISFFIDDEEPISARVAIGCALVVTAVLSMLSANLAGAEADPSVVLDADVVRSAGGYVGGGVSWVLLSLFGRVISNLVLVGAIVVGLVICGLSISGAVSSLRGKAQEAHELHTQRRELAAARREAYAQQEAEEAAAQAAPSRGKRSRKSDVPEGQALLPTDEAPTTYLGSRKTSVLKRGRAEDVPADDTADAGEAKTTLLSRAGRKSKKAQATEEAVDATAGRPVAVPDFLVDAQANAGEKSGSASPKGTGKKRGAQKCGPSAKPPKQAKRPGDGVEGFELPPLSLLSSNPNSAHSASSKEELDETMQRLQATLHEFGLNAHVVDYVSGPLVTTYRVEMGEGERVSRIKGLEDDIALTLAAGTVRIFAPIEGTSYVGIEVSNAERQNVHLGDVLPYVTGGPLEFAIGRDAAGNPVTANLQKMPHMLVAGTTGSGKSVALNALIMSIVMRNTPKQVRLILVDPKQVEFTAYKGLPHLYVPVVTEPKQAASALQWAVSEMERRLKIFAKAGVRDIGGYNKSATTGELSKMDNPPEPMPFLVIVIDELSDLMMTAGKEVEASIVRIAQLARAAGIHLVVATQQPTVQVVTGLIKANIDTRMALKVSQGINSRVIIDETGAERLLGRGDMLFKFAGSTRRVLGCYTSEEEVSSVVQFVSSQVEADYHEEILSGVVPGGSGGTGAGGATAEDEDPLLWEAAKIVVDSQLGSTSGLQRRLSVGYARAGRIMDMLEQKGVVGPANGSKPRDVLLDEAGLNDLMTFDQQYQEVE